MLDAVIFEHVLVRGRPCERERVHGVLGRFLVEEVELLSVLPVGVQMLVVACLLDGRWLDGLLHFHRLSWLSFSALENFFHGGRVVKFVIVLVLSFLLQVPCLFVVSVHVY